MSGLMKAKTQPPNHPTRDPFHHVWQFSQIYSSPCMPVTSLFHVFVPVQRTSSSSRTLWVTQWLAMEHRSHNFVVSPIMRSQLIALSFSGTVLKVWSTRLKLLRNEYALKIVMFWFPFPLLSCLSTVTDWHAQLTLIVQKMNIYYYQW